MVYTYCSCCLCLYCLGVCLSFRPYLSNYTQRCRIRKYMIVALIVILGILWLLGLLPVVGIGIPTLPLFIINGHPITLWSILILLVISSAISILPRPFQIVASLLLLLWILSELGILAITGLSHIIILAIIIGLVVS